MFNLIRRVSSSYLPRQDRPWREDATSTAPTIGRKRRLSSAEQDEDLTTKTKKSRGPAEEAAQTRDESPAVVQRETEEVKEVTKGVEGVELETTDDSVASASAEGLSVGTSLGHDAGHSNGPSVPAELEKVVEEGEEGSADGGKSSELGRIEGSEEVAETDPASVPLPADKDEGLADEGLEESADGEVNTAEDDERSSSSERGSSPAEEKAHEEPTKVEAPNNNGQKEAPKPEAKRATRSTTKKLASESSQA